MVDAIILLKDLIKDSSLQAKLTSMKKMLDPYFLKSTIVILNKINEKSLEDQMAFIN